MGKMTLQVADKQTLDKVDATVQNTEKKMDALKESCTKLADKTTLDTVKTLVDSTNTATQNMDTKIEEIKAQTGSRGG